MNGVEVLREAFRNSHVWFDGTIADVTPEQATRDFGGLTNSIGGTIAHNLQGEDYFITREQGREPLWVTGGWEQRVGVPFLMNMDRQQSLAANPDLNALREYAKAVYANTEAYLDSISDADLDKEIDLSSFGMGKPLLGSFLTMFSVGNNFAHTGEISALKGTLGAKGYPF